MTEFQLFCVQLNKFYSDLSSSHIISIGVNCHCVRINEWRQLIAYIFSLRRQNYRNKSYLAKAKSTDLNLRNLITLIRKRDPNHVVISYNSLICIYIIMCVIIHLLQSLSRFINTHTKAIRFDSRSHGHLFLIKCYLFVSLHEICVDVHLLIRINWFE